MVIYFDDVRQLERIPVREGERWLYSTDFNVKYLQADSSTQPKNYRRIDAEIDDLRQIAENGGIAVILAHQGRYGDHDVRHLDFIALALSEGTGRKVGYFPENNTDDAVKFVDALGPGDIAIMGNTRFHEGEEKNDPVLAGQFAGLVQRSDLQGYAAIGGFGKAHRANASNVGILEYLPGCITRSQIREMMLLEPWVGKKDVYSVAVLGGVKRDKITDGLVGLAQAYDSLIPGGIVLNTIYLVQGKKIGKSVVKDEGKLYDRYIREILNSAHAGKICIPEEVIIARPAEGGFEGSRKIPINDGMPEDYMIVDFVLSDSAHRSLERLASEGGRLILAGTPGIYIAGFRTATDAILDYMNKENINSIALGGDSSSEVKFKGQSSTGGGSALSFVAHGTTAVYEALRVNKRRFPFDKT